MKIAVNCWVLRNKQLDGIGYFTVNTVSRIIRDHPEVQFQILCDKGYTEAYFDAPNVTLHKIFPARRHPVLYVFFMELVLPFFLKKQKPDAFVSMEGFLSLFSGCRQLPVIHDINFEHQPGDLKLQNRLYFRFFFRRFARKAKRIATISEFSKKDIADHYGIDAHLIDNVSCGISSNFSPLPEEEKNKVRDKWSNGQPYFFFVGSMHPRKNIKRLLQAFELFKRETGSAYKLILAGSILWSKAEIEDTFRDSIHRNDIVFTGRLSDEELSAVLGSAFALSFVPIFEGFGLPIVEAMQCDVPVICSNVTSMPEVAGEAAVLVDPYSIESIAGGLKKMQYEDGLAAELIVKGREQRVKFSWDNTAALLWASIVKTVQ